MKAKEAFYRLKEFLKPIQKPSILLKIISIALLIIFFNPLVRLYKATIIEAILSHVETNWITEIIIFLSSILLLGIGIMKICRSVTRLLNVNILFILFLVAIPYWIIRWGPDFKDNFIYDTISGIKWLSYSDVIIGCLTLILLLSVIYHLIILKQLKRTALVKADEAAKEKLGEDELYRRSYAESIAKLIQNRKNQKDSFAIGIEGKWGTGKTTMMYFVKEYLSQDSNCIIIDFNPWYSSSPKALIHDFFATLQSELSIYNPNLESSFRSYSQLLTKFFNKSNAIDSLLDTLTGYPTTLKDKFEQVRKGIEIIGKQIIICIDDLDRLDKEEIVEVIRLIRNTANFSNTVFLVTYDKAYLISALKAINEYGNEAYLEKIFQQEVSLPSYRNTFLQEKLYFMMLSYIGKDAETWLYPLLFNPLYNAPDFDFFFRNIRDVTRFVNTFSLPFLQVKGDVNEVQFFYLQLLKYRFSTIYTLLQEDAYSMNWRNAQYFTLDNFGADYGKGIVIKAKETDITKKTESQYGIKEYLEQQDYSSQHIDIIIHIFEILFPFSHRCASRPDLLLDDYKQIYYLPSFRKYFAFQNFAINIPDKDIKAAFEETQEKLNEQITKWVKVGKYETLDAYFRSINKFYSQEDYKKILYALFIFANQPYPHDSSKIIGFNLSITRERLLYKNVKHLYKGESDHTAFILELFDTMKPPAHFPSQFLAEEMRNWDSNAKFFGKFPLTKDQLITINDKYLSQYLDISKQLTVNAFSLYQACDLYDAGAQIPSSSAGQLLINYATNKDLEHFLVFMIDHEGRDKNIFRLSALVYKLFNSIENFDAFLRKTKRKDSYYLEFMDFYNKIKEKENGYGQIEFPFKELKVNRE